MDKSDLEKIITIAEEGSMAQAAKKLYISQPALSKTLTKVETELGEILFTRRPSGLLPTYAGNCFIKKAYQIRKLYNDMEMDFCDLNQMHKGILKIGSAERLGALILPKLLKRFHEDFPNITFELIEDTSIVLEEKLLAGVIDLAIVCLPLNNSHVKFHIFHEEPIYLAIPRNHLLNNQAYKKPGSDMPFLSLNSVKNTPFILTRKGKKTRIAADSILSQLNHDYDVMIESYNIETVIRLVANGMGISLVPSSFAHTYYTGQQVNYYQIDDCNAPIWQWAVIYHDTIDSLSRPSRELYRILCEETAD